MRLDFTWSFRWSASILAGVLAITAGCSSPPDNKAGSSGSGSASTSGAPSEKPATSKEQPPEPAKPSTTPPATANSNDLPMPAPDVHPSLPFQPVEHDLPPVGPEKTEPPKK
jgi:hypothetical protein